MHQYTKTIISNKLVEVTHQPFQDKPTISNKGGRKSSTFYRSDNYEINIKKSISRARKQIRRLLECNFTEQYAFVTLTFDSNTEFDTTNISKCYERFTHFKKRLRYYLIKNKMPSFKYIGITEFQSNGAIHYHLVCNLSELSNTTIHNLWKSGWVNKDVVSSNALNNQKISYYLNKGIADPKLNGHKKYFYSKGLKKPIVQEINNLDEFYLVLDECNPTFKSGSQYEVPFIGEMKYEEYYLDNPKELIEYVQEA